MKSIHKIILFVGVAFFFFASSCDDYLDKAPESGTSEAEVFSKYQNFMKYFDGIYNGKLNDLSRPTSTDKVDGEFNIKCAYPLFWSIGNQKSSWEMMTEVADQGRDQTATAFKRGNYMQYSFIYTYANYRPILRAMFIVIRRANMALEKLHMLQDATQQDIDDIKGQAYFMRAYANFMLHKTWGPMPYVTKVIGATDPWDLERLPPYDYLTKIAADFDSAAYYFNKAGLMRRDNPTPGQPGHLTHPNMFRPNGCAAVALKARALLYAASPLNIGSAGQKAWEDAAKANWEAIQTALQHGYALLTPANYKQNFVGAQYSNEQIWGYYHGTGAYNASTLQWLINGPMSANKTANSPECPTQNGVDKFETKWGDPLNTRAYRDAATQAGHYYDQNPYVNRDPRFYTAIMYNGAAIPGYGTAKIYIETVNGKTTYSEQLQQDYAGITYTGYYSMKRWGGQSTLNRISPAMTDPLIRLAELYLNYAEAANEAYGPNTAAPGADKTAVEAINLIRDRFGMVPVQDQFTSNKDTFRDRIKNERFVELCYEGFHYYFDIRRWKDAPRTMTEGITGMEIEKLPAGYDATIYPTGYKYTRDKLLASSRQSVWKDAMYYFAFDLEDMQKMSVFKPNEVW